MAIIPVMLNGDSSLVRRVICPKRIGIELELGIGSGLKLWLGLASNFGICATLFWTNDLSDKWLVTMLNEVKTRGQVDPRTTDWTVKLLLDVVNYQVVKLL